MTLASPNSQLHLLQAGSQPCSAWVPSPGTVAWKLSVGGELSNLTSHLFCLLSLGTHFFSLPNAHVLSPVASKAVYNMYLFQAGGCF